MKENIQCLIKSEYVLAESPVWNKWRKSVLYIDIADKKVYEYKTQEEVTHCIELEGMVGTVVLVDENTIIAADKNKFVKINLDTHEKELLMEIDIPDNMRFNDGKCDDQGRLWTGSIVIERDIKGRFEKGSLYTIDANGERAVHRDKLTLSNGMEWDKERKVMYFTDTYTQKVDTYDYDSEKGTITYKETNIMIPKELGMPDGLTVDEEGMVWIALWNGGCVIRVNPNNGEILSRIELPEKNVTCCTFGGENLDRLYITTASDDEGNKGGLYCVQTTTRGRLSNLCKGTWLEAKIN